MVRASVHNKKLQEEMRSHEGSQTPRSSALRKITKSALTHNRGRDREQLRAFQGRGMDSAGFRLQWNKAFPYQKLTLQEARAVLPQFDRAGPARARRMMAAALSDFTDEDVRRARAKLTAASIAYKTAGGRAAGAAGLRGFVGSSMPPAILREQLKHTFSLHLTKRELGALFKDVDTDGSGTVDGAEFLMHFFRLGNLEQKPAWKPNLQPDFNKHMARRAQEEAEKKWLVEAAVAAHDRELAEIQAGVVAAGAGAFGPADVRSAYEKIGASSVRLERDPPNLTPFREGGPLAPNEFVRQIKRAYDLRLGGARCAPRRGARSASAPAEGAWTLGASARTRPISSYSNPDLALPHDRVNMYGESLRPQTTPSKLRSPGAPRPRPHTTGAAGRSRRRAPSPPGSPGFGVLGIDF
ncbi:hypothetical protein JL722_2253 [Aureococcus anophagefferens]|nr:hypothetical protein JL722_2253 [Aureococcus anophagefferens]